MRSLVWKDIRLNRLPLAVGFVLLFGPYIVASLILIRGYWPSTPSPGVWGSYMLTTATFGLSLSAVTLGMLAGNAIACERADGSAAFLAGLPVSRAKVAGSKAMVILAAGVFIWATHLIVMYGIAPGITYEPESLAGMDQPVGFAARAGIVALGVGWSASARLASPAIAICCGLGAMILVPVTVYLVWILIGWSVEPGLAPVMSATQWIVGLLALGGGTVYYLRRVEP